MTYSRGSWCVWVLLCKYSVHSHAPVCQTFPTMNKTKAFSWNSSQVAFGVQLKVPWLETVPQPQKLLEPPFACTGRDWRLRRDTKECQIIALLNYCWLLLTATLLILLLEMKQTRTAHMHTCRRRRRFLFVVTGYLHSSYSNVKLRHTSTSAAGRRRRRSDWPSRRGSTGQRAGEEDHLHMVVASMFQKRMFIFDSISKSLSNWK